MSDFQFYIILSLLFGVRAQQEDGLLKSLFSVWVILFFALAMMDKLK